MRFLQRSFGYLREFPVSTDSDLNQSFIIDESKSSVLTNTECDSYLLIVAAIRRTPQERMTMRQAWIEVLVETHNLTELRSSPQRWRNKLLRLSSAIMIRLRED